MKDKNTTVMGIGTIVSVLGGVLAQWGTVGIDAVSWGGPITGAIAGVGLLLAGDSKKD